MRRRKWHQRQVEQRRPELEGEQAQHVAALELREVGVHREQLQAVEPHLSQRHGHGAARQPHRRAAVRDGGAHLRHERVKAAERVLEERVQDVGPSASSKSSVASWMLAQRADMSMKKVAVVAVRRLARRSVPASAAAEADQVQEERVEVAEERT